MLRFPIVVAVGALVVGLVAVSVIVGRGDATGAAVRQTASPEAEDGRVRPVASPGIERVGCGPIADENAGLTLEFNEVRFAPGQAIEENLYWQPVIAYVLSGQVELNLIEAPTDGAAQLRTLDIQDSDHQPWQCAASEDLNPGPVTLTAGDAVYLENARYRISNPFARDAVLLTAVIEGDDFNTCQSGCPRWP
jgi:hypothetical protein